VMMGSMTVSIRRAASVGLVILALLTVAAFMPATALAKTSTKLSIGTADSGSIVKGVLKTKSGKALRSKRVYLFLDGNPVASKKTAAGGKVSFGVSGLSPGHGVWTLSFKADRNYRASKSRGLAVVPTMTMGQKQAVGKAKSYLNFMCFSRKGLIAQLAYEGFSEADSTFAVDYIAPDWNAQAAGKAKSYLDFMSFSRQGLIDQLLFEGFTQAQAEYGVSAVGY
jgi:hypothetical protein